MADNQEIIIKKVKKGGHGGHHSSAWKIAYADFVTAMMAFFLLLWLLNVTTEEQRNGIADYFSPSIQISKTSSGADGLLAGRSIAENGALISSLSNVGITMNLSPEEVEGEEEQEEGKEDGTKGDGKEDGLAKDEELQEYLREKEREEFVQTAEGLREAVIQNPELEGLADNILIDQTPDGLRIQLVDEENTAMFPSGSSDMHPRIEKLMGLVAEAIAGLDNKIRISGHTDAQPFQGKSGFSNWELSAQRANASRRALINGGLTPERIASVVGLAETEPFVKEDPLSPKNRRISMTLLKDKSEDALIAAKRKMEEAKKKNQFRSLDL